MNFIIIGDKYQKGMKSKGCAGLIKINKNSTLFEHQYDVIRTYFPNAKIIYIGGFESKKIESYISKNYSDVIYVNNIEYEKLNDAHSISLVKSLLVNDTFIIFGYTFLDRKIFENFDIKLGSQIVVTPNSEKQIGSIINQNKIDNISFDLPNYIEDIYYLSMKDSQILQNIVSNTKYKNYFLFELINKLIDGGTMIKPFFYKRSNKKNKYYEYTK